MRFFSASVFVALVAAVSAYTQPDYSKPPTGNAIATPGLNQQVPVGSPFEITWDPTTPGTVSLVLLRGPSTDVKPLYAIANKIPNNGKFSWTPSEKLKNDVTHYGLLLVDDATGQYQYSTQFGIKNPDAVASSSGSSSQVVVPITATTTICPVTESASPSPVATTPAFPVGTGNATVPVVSPTKTPYVPTTLSSATASVSATSPPAFTGAADHNMANFGGAAVVAGLAALLAF